jgi:predicted ATP-grasp superfamily ATP-dependent carboligase
LRLLVYEYVSGGGFAEKPFALSVLAEGFGMLRTLIADFAAAGHSVTTVLDSRLAVLCPPLAAESVASVSSWEAAQVAVQEARDSAEAAYVIAPESNDLLESFVASLTDGSVQSLNCTASAIGEVSDKAALQARVKRLGLPAPETATFSVHDDTKDIMQTVNEKIGFPAVFKPVNEVGCNGLSIARSENEVAGAIKKMLKETSSLDFIAQEFVKGESASVSLISTGDEALPISFNKQNVSLRTPDSASTYHGGFVPLDNPLRREAFAMAKRVVESIRGLVGYVGVDFVLTEKKPVLIELNPRLTTSYVGLRKVVGLNPAKAIVDAVTKHKLPESIESVGYAYFSKVKTPKATCEALQRTYKIRELVSPPFPASDNDGAYALLSSTGSTLQEARMEFGEAEKRLLSIISEGGEKPR